MNSSNIPDAAPKSLAGSKRQFSLLSLLVVILIACLVVGYVDEHRRRQHAESELRRKTDEVMALRTELGLGANDKLLEITDNRLVHIRATPTHDQTSWAWRVFLPPGKLWRLGVTQGEQWDEARLAFLSKDDSRLVDLTGEVTIDAWIAKHLNGQS